MTQQELIQLVLGGLVAIFGGGMARYYIKTWLEQRGRDQEARLKVLETDALEAKSQAESAQIVANIAKAQADQNKTAMEMVGMLAQSVSHNAIAMPEAINKLVSSIDANQQYQIERWDALTEHIKLFTTAANSSKEMVIKAISDNALETNSHYILLTQQVTTFNQRISNLEAKVEQGAPEVLELLRDIKEEVTNALNPKRDTSTVPVVNPG